MEYGAAFQGNACVDQIGIANMYLSRDEKVWLRTGMQEDKCRKTKIMTWERLDKEFKHQFVPWRESVMFLREQQDESAEEIVPQLNPMRLVAADEKW